MLSGDKTYQPYPYSIPPAPQLDSESLKKLDLWNALEFFRVEALLRSESAQTLYRQISKQGDESVPTDRLERWKLLTRHVFKRKGETASNVSRILSSNTLREDLFVDDGWLVLWGAHHRYLRPDPFLEPAKQSEYDISDGILDLSAFAREGNLDWLKLRHDLEQKQKLFLFVRIECSVPPETNLKALRPLLRDRHKALTIHQGEPIIDPETGMHTFPV